MDAKYVEQRRPKVIRVIVVEKSAKQKMYEKLEKKEERKKTRHAQRFRWFSKREYWVYI